MLFCQNDTCDFLDFFFSLICYFLNSFFANVMYDIDEKDSSKNIWWWEIGILRSSQISQC